MLCSVIRPPWQLVKDAGAPESKRGVQLYFGLDGNQRCRLRSRELGLAILHEVFIGRQLFDMLMFLWRLVPWVGDERRWRCVLSSEQEGQPWG